MSLKGLSISKKNKMLSLKLDSYINIVKLKIQIGNNMISYKQKRNRNIFFPHFFIYFSFNAVTNAKNPKSYKF